MDAYRFVVAFRREKTSDASVVPTWRGWVERVYPEIDDGDERRQWFQEVADVSPLIASMIERKERSDD